jgi:hypothetical protein
MVRHKGARSNQQREADHPHAVDIPIPGGGLRQNLNVIHQEADRCTDGAEVWSHCTHGLDGTPQDWCRIGTKDAADADRLVGVFGHLQARRVR